MRYLIKRSKGMALVFLGLVFVLPVSAVKYLADRVNGDAAVDLLHISSSNQLMTETGDGVGGFAAPVSINLNINPVSIELGDFNADGFKDIIALDDNGQLSLSLHDNTSGFLNEVILPVGLQALESIIAIDVADLNGDGFLDVAVLIDGLLHGRVILLHGDGQGGFAPLVNLEINALIVAATGLSLSDLNTDGTVDVLVKDVLGTVHLLLSDGMGGYQLPSTLAGVLPTGSIYFADFNNDQTPDMVVLDELLGLLTIRLGNGDGSFLNGVAISVGLTPTDVVAVDLNLDGNTDLAVVNIGDNSINVLIGDGLGGLFELVGQVLEDLLGVIPALGLPAAVISHDFNGDCRLDLGVWNDLTQSYTIQLNQTGPDLNDLVFCSVFEY